MEANLHDALFGRTNNTPSGPFGVPQPTGSPNDLFTTINVADGPSLLNTVQAGWAANPYSTGFFYAPLNSAQSNPDAVQKLFIGGPSSLLQGNIGEMNGILRMNENQATSYAGFAGDFNDRQVMFNNIPGLTTLGPIQGFAIAGDVITDGSMQQWQADKLLASWIE